MTKLRIRIAEGADFSWDVLVKLRRYFAVDTTACRQEMIQSILHEYDVFWFRLGFKIRKEDLPGKIQCKVIATPVTGIDHIDVASCETAGIKIISLKGETEFLRGVRATAEHSLLLTLMLLRQPSQAFQSVSEGVWNRDLFRGHEIFGKTVGIIGMGRLGEITGSYFRSMGATLIGFDKPDVKCEGILKVSSLDEIAKRADIVSIHLSLNDSTTGIINDHFFGMMKKNAILINTSRGGIVDEDALLSALSSGGLKAAALDVLSDEKLSMRGHRLVEYAASHGNLLITPHIGGNTYESFLKTENFIADKIISFFRL